MPEIPCNADDGRCVATELLDVLGRKYAMDVVCVVANHGTVRFSELADHFPDASTSTLSTRLDELEAEGLVGRERYDEIPPRVEYELTEEGAELGERLRPLIEWMAERAESGGERERDSKPDRPGNEVSRERRR